MVTKEAVYFFQVETTMTYIFNFLFLFTAATLGASLHSQK